MRCRFLQNRRLQVRFLSHLPLEPEFMRIAASWPQHEVCVVTPYLTQFHTTKSNTAGSCVPPAGGNFLVQLQAPIPSA
jgi:hypothetical protein